MFAAVSTQAVSRGRVAFHQLALAHSHRFVSPAAATTTTSATTAVTVARTSGWLRRVSSFSTNRSSFPRATSLLPRSQTISQRIPKWRSQQPFLLHQSLLRHSILSPQLGAITHFSSSPGGGGAPRPGGSRVAQGMGLLGAASVLFGKTKYLLAALKLTKLASLGSMVLTIGTYSMFFGWPYAAGMVGLIAVHEAGHALVLHSKGIPFHPAVFVPFFGAVIVSKQLPRDAWEDAVVGYGGPALGSLGAGVVAVGAGLTESQLLYALADFGFMINLFNLLPIGSMDGGRITGAISPYVGLAGIGLGGALAYSGAIANPIFYLVLLSGSYETFMRLYDPVNHLPPNYYNVSWQKRATMTVGYFGLIAALLAAMDANRRHRKPPEVLMRERELEKTFDMR